MGVRAGKIVSHWRSLGGAKAAEIFEARGLHVLPGVIDSQVHFREPGNAHKEDLETGSRAAVLGGVTGIFEMPNTYPPTTTRAAMEDKLARAKNRMHCDYAFYIGATPANLGALAELGAHAGRGPREGVPRVIDWHAAAGSRERYRDDAAQRAASRGRAFLEDEDRLKARKHLAVPGDPRVRTPCGAMRKSRACRRSG